MGAAWSYRGASGCRRWRRLLGLCWALACLLGLASPVDAPVLAAVVHAPRQPLATIPIESRAALSGPLTGVNAITVDAGRLYAAEGKETYKVDAFTASSLRFAAQFRPAASLAYLHQGIAVGHATGRPEVYVGGDETRGGGPTGVVAVFSGEGYLQAVWSGRDAPAGSFGCFECAGAADVAVDNSSGLDDWAAGDVYVSDPSAGVVDVFRPLANGAEEYVTQLTGTCIAPGPCSEIVPFVKPTSVAVSGLDGDVLVADDHAVVDIFRPAVVPGQYEFAGSLTRTPSGPLGEIDALAVDGSGGDIFIARRTAVDEFDSSGDYLGRVGSPDGGRGEFNDVLSVAVDPAPPHLLYVGDSLQNERSVEERGLIDVYGPDRVVPDVETGPPSRLSPNAVVLTGGYRTSGGGRVACRFAWGVTAALERVTACAAPTAGGPAAGGPAGAGPAADAARASLTGLRPDTRYCYRLEASNRSGTNAGEPWQTRCFLTSGPGIRAQWSANVGATSATLDAAIEPNGGRTAYYFQYGTSAVYGGLSPRRPNLVLQGAAAGGAGANGFTRIAGLRPDTVYHYRVVAIASRRAGKPEAFYGPDRTFLTPPIGVAGLPDGRAWETVVSLPGGGPSVHVGRTAGVVQASAAGAAITYPVDRQAESESRPGASVAQALATRGSGREWVSRYLLAPERRATAASGHEPEFLFFSGDLSRSLVQPLGRLDAATSSRASPAVTEQTPFLHEALTGGDPGRVCAASCDRPLVTAARGHADVAPGTRFGEERACSPESVCGPRFVGATPNLAHVVLESDVALTSTPIGRAGLYEWSAGRLTLLSLLPDGRPAVAPALGQLEEGARNAISDDGRRVAWESARHLYLRDTALGRTIQLDAVQGGRGTGDPVPRFQFASRDGSKVFFLDGQRLTRDSNGSVFAHGGDLYECRIVAVAGRLRCELSDLTPAPPEEHADVEGVVGGSEDGSWIYFVANDVLVPGAVHGHCQGRFAPRDSRCDLYLHHGGRTTLVAVLTHADAPDWANGAGLFELTAQVSPDGRWLAFMSQRSLTGADTHDLQSGHPDEEVYLYDAVAKTLACASCTPTGERPRGVPFAGLEGGAVVGAEAWGRSESLAAAIPAWTPSVSQAALRQPRYVFDSGRLFFDSDDALQPTDRNASWDVYEYEPPGVGGCTVSDPTFGKNAKGCVGLVSAAAPGEASAFLDASDSGGDVFYLSERKAAGVGAAEVLYDAHAARAPGPCAARPWSGARVGRAACRAPLPPLGWIFGFGPGVAPAW